MAQAEERNPNIASEEGIVNEIVEKVKVIVKGPHGALFSKVVESFFEQTEPEDFSPEDLVDIQEGLEDIRQGRYLTLEEYRRGKRL